MVRKGNATTSTCTSTLPGIEPICSAGRKILYLHFSKTSGTALCKLVRKIGCSTWPKVDSANCESRKRGWSDGPWWIPRSHGATLWQRVNFGYPEIHNMPQRLSCERRLAQAPSFHAVESTLPAGALCPGFFTVTLLRPPLERMVSNSYELARWGLVVPPKQGLCRNYSHMRRLAPVVYDNYYIRVLLGERVLSLRCLPSQRTRVTFEFADPRVGAQLGFCATPPMYVDHRPALPPEHHAAGGAVHIN